jgi:hypothetical protein
VEPKLLSDRASHHAAWVIRRLSLILRVLWSQSLQDASRELPVDQENSPQLQHFSEQSPSSSVGCDSADAEDIYLSTHAHRWLTGACGCRHKRVALTDLSPAADTFRVRPGVSQACGCLPTSGLIQCYRSL